MQAHHVLGDARVGGEGGDALGRGSLLQDRLDRRVAVQRHQLGQLFGVLRIVINCTNVHGGFEIQLTS